MGAVPTTVSNTLIILKPKWLFQRYIVSHGHVHRTYFGGSVYVVPGIDMEQHRNIHNPHKQDTRHVGCK